MTASERPRDTSERPHDTSDEHLGAVEGDRSADPQQGNPNADALDSQGLPEDCDKIAQDVIGATNDETQG